MPKVKTNFKTKRKTYIREWRKHRHLTQDQLGERLNVTGGTISQLEAGRINYTQAMLEALAEALGCPNGPADLLMRNPLDTDSPYSILDSMTPVERKRAAAILIALKQTGT